MLLQTSILRALDSSEPLYGIEFRKILRLGGPIIVAQLAHISLGFIDTIMAGNLSAATLGAVAVGRSVYSPILFLTLGILLVISPIIAFHHGANNEERIAQTVRQGLWLALFLSIPGMLLIRNLQSGLEWLNVTPELIPVSMDYLRALSWGIPAALSYLVLRFFHEGISVSKPNLYFTLLAIPVNIVGNFALMYGYWGFPALGAEGAGWATTLVWWIMLSGMVLLNIKQQRFCRFHVFSRIEWPDLNCFKYVLKIGLPNGVSAALENSMFAASALVISSLGVTGIASHQIAINFASITFMIPLGLSMAISSSVGYAHGQQCDRRAWIAGKVGMGLSVLAMIISATVILLWPEHIAAVYTVDEEVLQMAAHLLLFAGIFQISDGLQISAAGALRGLKDTRVPMLVNAGAFWGIGFPLGYFLAIHRGMGPEGFWIGWIAGLACAAIFHPWRFYRLTHGGNN